MDILKERHDDEIKRINLENVRKIRSLEEEQTILSILFYFYFTLKTKKMCYFFKASNIILKNGKL